MPGVAAQRRPGTPEFHIAARGSGQPIRVSLPSPQSRGGRKKSCWWSSVFCNRPFRSGFLVNLASRDGPDPIDVAVGSRVRIRRRQMDMSQTALAKALGVTFQQVQKYERGTNRISASMLVRIGSTLGVTVADLVGKDDVEATDESTYAQLSASDVVELISAFAQIRDAEARRAVIAIVRTLGGVSSAAKAPRKAAA